VDARTGLPVVGMIGAGQLARMTHQAAIALGQSLKILADSAEDGAALVASDVVVGDYRDLANLRSFARGCDAVTWDHEHVPNEHIRALTAEGVNVHPGADALRFAQDKGAMRARLAELGIASPRWTPVTDPETLKTFGDEVGWPLVLKATTGGYDGKGVWVVASPEQARDILTSGTDLLAEERVDLVRELAAVVARSPYGQAAAWPVVETVQKDGINTEVIAPAPGLPNPEAIQQLALTVAAELGVTGVLAVELFETADGRILVNELAMRPHNSAHWTIEGSNTSQFEQHVRAVLDYPLGTTTLTAPVVVSVNLLCPTVAPQASLHPDHDDVQPKALDERMHHTMARWPEVKIHLYGKAMRPGRKVGHLTVLGDDLATIRARANAAADYLMNGERDA